METGGTRGRDARTAGVREGCRIPGCTGRAAGRCGLCSDCEAEMRWLQQMGDRAQRVRCRQEARGQGRRVRPSLGGLPRVARGLLLACVELVGICVVIAIIWCAVVLCSALGMGLGEALQ